MVKDNKSFFSILNIILGFFIILIFLLGSSLSIFFSVKKTILSSDFSSSYNIRYEFDPYTSNDPRSVEKTWTEKALKSEMMKISDAYSNILLRKNVSSSNVHSEVFQDEKAKFHAYIDISLPISKVKTFDPSFLDKQDNEKMQDIAPSIAYYNNMYTGDFSIIYCDGYEYDEEKSIASFDSAKLYSWNIFSNDGNGLTDDSNKISFDSSSSKINIKLKNGFSFGKKISETGPYQEDTVKYIFDKAKNPDTLNSNELKKQKYPFMFIFNNFRGLLNKCEYLAYLGFEYNRKQKPSEFVVKAYWQLDDSERQFANDVSNEKNHLINDEGALTHFDFKQNAGFQTDSYSKLNSHTTNNKAIKTSPYDGKGNFSNSVIFKLLQTYDSFDNQKICPGKTIGAKYQFMNEYLLSIVTRENFKDFLPDKNPTKTSIDSDGLWLSIPTTSSKKFTLKEHYELLAKNAMSLPLMDVCYPTNINSSITEKVTDYIVQKGLSNNSIYIQKLSEVLNHSFCGLNNIISVILSLLMLIVFAAFLFFLFYKVFGLISSCCIITTLSLSLLVMIFSGYTFSFSILVGLILTLLLGVISSFNFLNRLKKQYLQHKTLDLCLMNCFKSSFMPTLDFHVVIFLLGISMLFFQLGDIITLGLTLMIGSLFSMALLTGFNYLILFFIFCNNIGMYKFRWLSNVKLDNSFDSVDPRYVSGFSANNVNYQKTGFGDGGFVSRFRFFNKVFFTKKTFFLSVVIFILIFVAAIVKNAYGGFFNSFTYFGGTRVMISTENGTLQNVLEILKQYSWHNIKQNTDWIYLDTVSVIDVSAISSLLKPNSFYLQTINPLSSIEFLKNSIYILLLFTAFVFIWSIIRYNFVGALSILFLSILLLMLTFACISIFSIPLDAYLSFSLIITLALAFILFFCIFSAVTDHWNRKNLLTNINLLNIFMQCFDDYSENLIHIFAFFSLMFFINLIFMPRVLVFMNLIIFLNMIMLLFVIIFSFPYFVYVLTNIKNKYSLRVHIIQSGIEKINYDKVDEQLIKGINTH